ncbi:MAG: PLP-dependent transferase [Cyanobacteria bacterium P01_B01_bin.77]
MARHKKSAQYNVCVEPIYRSSSYFFESAPAADSVPGDKIGRYGRYGNPTWVQVEKRIAELDKTDDALLFASGMNAITTALLAFAKPQDTIIFTGNCYKHTRSFIAEFLNSYGVHSKSVNYNQEEDFSNSIVNTIIEATKIVFLEIPSNPHLYLVDIKKISNHLPPNCLLIVDSTLASPVNLSPINFGADLVIHSCTKYLGGHGDLLAGSISGSTQLIDIIRNYRNMMGGIVDPQCAFLLGRSLDSLQLRMRYLNDAGITIANFLEQKSNINTVFYTGLKSHPHYHLATQYLTGHGAVITFEIEGDQQTAAQFIDELEIPFMGSNFGTSATMIEQCSVFTYYHLDRRQRYEQGISDSLVRMSLGYEDTELLVDDLSQALDKVV